MAAIKFTAEGLKKADWRLYKYVISPKDKSIKLKRRKSVFSPSLDAALLGLNVYPDEMAVRVQMNPVEEMFEAMQVKTKVSPVEVAEFYNAIAKSLKANLAIGKSLEKCAGLAKSPYFRGVIGTICYYITKEGGKLSVAMALFPNVFEASTLAMVEAGESSGEITGVFQRLGSDASENVRIARKIKGALVYPLVLGLAITGVVMLMQFFVIPKMMPMFQSMSRGQLPLSTRIVMGAGNVLKTYPWLGLVPFLLVFVLKRKWSAIAEDTNFQRSIIKVPVLGETIKTFSLIKSLRTLGILLKAIAPLGPSFEIAARVSGNIVVGEYYTKISKRCVAGQSMSVAFAAERHALGDIGADISEQIAIGESTGSLNQVIQEIIAKLQEELMVKLDMLPNLANFVMLSLFAPVILLIALAVVEPSLKMAEDTLTSQQAQK